MTLSELMEIVPGPDFPTGGSILGRAGIRQAYETSRGSVLIRGVSSVETIRKDREAIIFTEIPYQVNKATLIEKIAELVRDKKIEGISDLRDESDRQGMRIVIEIKRDAVADVVLNQLHRFTALQSSFGVNIIALNGGRPESLNLLDCLQGLHRLPRGSRQPPHQIPAQQGARRRPYPGRPRHRRRQYRRSDPADPHLRRRRLGARSADEPPVAGP